MTTPTLPPVLARARELAGPALRAAVAGLHPEVARVAAYHFGWQDRDGHPTSGNGGKALRPALALLSAEAVGADARVGLPGAVAVELVHNFSLLHDDLMDGDEERRHRPTAWKAFGPGAAILAGDALLALAERTVLDAGGAADGTGRQAARHLTRAVDWLIDGQAADLAFERRQDVKVDECLAMARGKTGALLGCSASIGALLAGAPGATVAALDAFGQHLGLAFQAVDDLLGIWGRPEVTGKPTWSDLRQRKKSLPVVLALDGGGPPAERLAAWLAAGPDGDRDLALAAELVEVAGGRQRTTDLAEQELAHALDLLGRLRAAGLAGAALAELDDLARFVTAREL
jgi:geranylgeranyl diphosphate synthase type I